MDSKSNKLDSGTTTDLCACNQKLSSATMPDLTPGSSDANVLADSLGVSPMYRQLDSARWQNAAQVYHSSRASPIPSTGNFNFDFGDNIKSPLSTEDIADMNRGQKEDSETIQLDENVGPLELEVISALHELAPFVDEISVSELLPKTAELIFLNVKTKDDLPYTLELTFKGWRICSNRSDCMYGDYLNVDFYVKYYHNAKEILKIISPDHYDRFADSLTERLKQLQDEETFKRSLSPHLNQDCGDDSVVSIPVPKSASLTDITDATMFL